MGNERVDKRVTEPTSVQPVHLTLDLTRPLAERAVNYGGPEVSMRCHNTVGLHSHSGSWGLPRAMFGANC